MIWLKRKIKVLVINPPPRIHKKDIKNLLQILQIYYGYEEKMWRSVFNVPLGLTFWHWKSLSIHFHHQLWVLLRQLLSSLPLNQSCFGPIRTCTRLSSYIFTSAMMHSFLVLNLQAKPGKGYTYIQIFKCDWFKGKSHDKIIPSNTIWPTNFCQIFDHRQRVNLNNLYAKN